MKKLRLARQAFEHDGIIGTLYDDSSGAIAVTLEHAYSSGHGDGSYIPKLPNGTYTCKRGMHRLHDLKPFETFEVEGVPGHDNILFHVGNWNDDSEGCILLGAKVLTGTSTVITESRITFSKFMNLLKDLNTFTLVVE